MTPTPPDLLAYVLKTVRGLSNVTLLGPKYCTFDLHAGLRRRRL
jgi:hypothetical protein